MIRREGERQKRTKNLPLNPPSSAVPSNVNVSSHQVLRDISESLGHLHKESTTGQPPVSTASCHSVPSFGSPSLVCSQSVGITKSESMQIKSEYMNANAAPQNSIAGIGGGGGILQVSGAVGASPADSRTGNAVKSAQSGYRQKALQEIRISLLPFANSDKPNSELSSASSTTSDSSSPSQTSGNCSSSVVSGHSSSSGQNGLDKDLNAHRHALQQLLAMGYTEEAALRVLKLGKGSDAVETLLKQQDNSQSVGINGLTRTSHGLGPLPLKPLRKSSLQDGLGQRGSCSSTVDSSSASNRSDSPCVNLGNFPARLLPDSPRIMGNNMQCMDNSSSLLSHIHGQLSKQHSQNFPPNDPPPPPPPPRGMPGPPPTPPRGTTPPPSSGSQVAQSQYAGSGGLVSSQVQHFLKRISPVPQNSSRPQALSYTSSSVSSSSSPQRGTSPVSFGRPPHMMSSIGQSQQQLAQQLQTLSMYSSSNLSTRVDPPPPYPSGSSHSPASLSSQYSSPPPSYAASSSSGRQSPTPTISSSEYSVPPIINLQLPKRAPPSSYASSSSSIHSPSPAHPSNSPAVTAATVVTSVLPRSSVLQACSARQAKSQSPIIMQSVKSTQVQKPVLQTAIAPTSPPVNPSPPSFTASSQPVNLPPVYSTSVPGQSTSQSSYIPTASSHVHTSFAVAVQTGCSNQPSYASVPNPVINSLSYQPAAHNNVANPPPYPTPHQNQPNNSQGYSSVMWHQAQNPPPYTAASLGQQTNTSQFPSATNSQASNPPPYPASAGQGSNPPPPPPYTSALQQQLSTSSAGSLQNQHMLPHDVPSNFTSSLPPYSNSSQNANIGLQETIANKNAPINNTPMYSQNPHNQTALCQESLPPAAHSAQVATTVPTTDPPSYASSVAALAAQRAAVVGSSVINNNVPTFNNVGPPTHCAYTTASSASSVTTVPGNSNLVPSRMSALSPPPSGTVSATSDLVTTVESICSSQVTALQGTNNNIIRNNLNDLQNDNYSIYSTQHQQLQRKPSPVAMDTGSSASRSASRSESPVSHGMSQSPVSFMSTASTSSPSTQSDSTHDSAKVSSISPYKTLHQSPIPPRKQLSKEKEEERRETKVRNYSPAAFKFFMEQHVENLLKSHQQREHRRLQLESEMAKVGLSEEAQCQMRRMLHQKESNYIRLKRAKMDKSMFVKIKTIGVGAFGEVALVRKVDANQLYAMKTLRKTDVLKRNQVAHVKAERDILAEADNEWVVKLYYSFQDKDNLYFVMDYIPGGDLMSLLIKFGIFQEPLARFYVAELVLAVESVHKMGFIHRDIKPDNILIDKDGHIKLTDFGLCTGFRWTHNSKYYQRNGEHARQDSMDPDENWSNECHCNSSANLKPLERRRRREHQRCLAHSLVGTPNYIAPEVLMRTGYTQLCDWWSVGVILYEMLVGQPPFMANTPAETQYKIINWETTLHIPKAASLSTEATDLILKLCCGPDKRLGKNGAEEIKKHSFFNALDFDGGLRKQPAPYVPRIRYAADTSNFDPIDPDKLRNSSGSSGDGSKSEETYENGKHPEHAFFEFTFRRFFDDGGQAYPVRNPVDDNENQGSPVF